MNDVDRYKKEIRREAKSRDKRMADRAMTIGHKARLAKKGLALGAVRGGTPDVRAQLSSDPRRWGR